MGSSLRFPRVCQQKANLDLQDRRHVFPSGEKLNHRKVPRGPQVTGSNQMPPRTHVFYTLRIRNEPNEEREKEKGACVPGNPFLGQPTVTSFRAGHPPAKPVPASFPPSPARKRTDEKGHPEDPSRNHADPCLMTTSLPQVSPRTFQYLTSKP